MQSLLPLPCTHYRGRCLPLLHLQGGVLLGAVSVAVDSNGKYGAVSSLDSTVHVWDMDNLEASGVRIEEAPGECWGVAFAPRHVGEGEEGHGLLLAIAGGSGNCVKVVDVLAGGKRVHTLQMPQVGGWDGA